GNARWSTPVPPPWTGPKRSTSAPPHGCGNGARTRPARWGSRWPSSAWAASVPARWATPRTWMCSSWSSTAAPVPRPGTADAVATQIQRILSAPAAGTNLKVNADLRPEGRAGLLARSLEAWCDYYRRDAQTWEKQALLRARPVVASEAVSARLREEMDRHRYPAGGLDDSRRREITRMKARVESERLPRGADPSRHLKLGRGGMTDVEWSVQITTLDRAHDHPALRTTSTMDALRAAG